MSKICILGDTHFGVQNDSPFFLKYSLDYFEKVFFPYLREHNIKTVIHLGDVFDRRKFINMNTLNKIKTQFLKPFYEEEFKLYCIIGNHDVYFKNTNKINSLNELLNDKVTVCNEPRVINIHGYDLGFVPWITQDNNIECLNFIKNVPCELLFGHFELLNFEVTRGIKSQEGISSDLFNGFYKVFSGHFHCKQEKNNVLYVGTPYQLNFSDINEIKGFHVFDLKDKKTEFIENKNKIFKQLKYNDQKNDMLNINFEQYEGSFVKVIVENKTQPYSFERFMENLNSVYTAGITVIEESMFELSNEELSSESQDTLSIINREIDHMEDIENKNKLKQIIHELYVESLSN